MQMKKKDLCNMIVKKMAIFCDMKIGVKWQYTDWVLLWTWWNINFWDPIDISNELLNTFNIVNKEINMEKSTWRFNDMNIS